MRASTVLTRSRLRFLAAALATLSLTGGQPLPAADTPSLPAEVLAALRDNQESLDPVTVEYAQKYTSRISRREAMDQLRMGDRPEAGLFFESKHRVSWQRGKLYAYLTRYNEGGSKDFVEDEASFDGSVLYSGSHGNDQPTLFKRFMKKVMKAEPQSYHLRQEYFQAAGYHFPTMKEWDKPRVTSDVLYRLENGGTLESVESVTRSEKRLLRISLTSPNPTMQAAKAVSLKEEEELLKSSRESPERQKELLDVIRRQQQAEGRHQFVYFLDPSLHHSVVHWEEGDPKTGRLVRVCDNSDFNPLQGRQVQLPKRSEIRYHQFDHLPDAYFANPFMSQVFEVSSIDTAEVSDSTFVLNFTDPGAYIRDATLPEAAKDPEGYISYTIPARGGDLDNVISRARQGERFDPVLPPAPSTGLSRLLVVVNIMVFAVVVVFLLYRYGVRNRSQV